MSGTSPVNVKVFSRWLGESLEEDRPLWPKGALSGLGVSLQRFSTSRPCTEVAGEQAQRGARPAINNPHKRPRPFWPQGWAGRAPSPPGAPTAAGPGDTEPPSAHLAPSLGTRSGRANIGSETPQGERLCPPTGKEMLPEALSLGAHDGPWGHPLPFSRQRGPRTPPGKGPSHSSSRSNRLCEH